MSTNAQNEQCRDKSPRRTLYLHIGMPKAGSTSIQNFLEKSASTLPVTQVRAFGLGNAWKIAAAAKTELSYSYWVKIRKKLSEHAYKDFDRSVWRNAQQEIGSSKAQKFVTSSEYIYFLYGQKPEAISDLRQRLLDIFDVIKVIVYIRDQVSALKSIYAQRVVGPYREKRNYKRYIREFDFSKTLLNYDNALAMWESNFGFENMSVNLFDKENFMDGNLVTDFLLRLDIDTVSARSLACRNILNVSPTYGQINLMRVANRFAINRRLQRMFLLHPFLRLMPPKDIPSDLDEIIAKNFCEGNRAVNERYFRESKTRLKEL